MDFPKRVNNHITETDSWKVMKDRAPKHWIIRELSERDYGIDAYIEIPHTNGDVAGDLLSVQLKGTESLEWCERSEPKQTMFSGIQKSTVNYWMALPVPVFLVVCDLKTRLAYFAPVKSQVRQRYNELQNQGTFGFELFEYAELGTNHGQALFVVEYLRERQFKEIETAILTVQSNWASYLSFIREKSNLDAHFELEDHEETLFAHIHQTLTFVGSWLGIKVPLPELRQIYKEDMENFKNDWYHLHQWSLNKVMPQMHQTLFDVLTGIQSLLTVRQKDYWRATHSMLYRSALNLEIEEWRKGERSL